MKSPYDAKSRTEAQGKGEGEKREKKQSVQARASRERHKNGQKRARSTIRQTQGRELSKGTAPDRKKKRPGPKLGIKYKRRRRKNTRCPKGGKRKREGAIATINRKKKRTTETYQQESLRTKVRKAFPKGKG